MLLDQRRDEILQLIERQGFVSLHELVDKLGAEGAAAVGFDVMFAEPDRTSPKAATALWQLTGKLRGAIDALPDHDEALAESLAASVRGNADLINAQLAAPATPTT